MSVGLNVAIRNARAQVLIDAIDAGSGNGKIEFYSLNRPITGGATTIKLGTCDLSKPSASVANGTIVFNAIADDVSADGNGVITWARVTDSDNTFVMDLSCGVAGSGAEVIFNTTQVATGGVIQLQTAQMTEGSA